MSDIVDKISKLLVLAEQAPTQEERDAYMTKVQVLATTAQVDLEEARQRQADKTKREVPERRTLTLYDRWAYGPKPRNLPFMVSLIASLSFPNSVSVEIYQDNHAVLLYGFPSDIDVVETLFGSVSVQMVAAADTALKNGEHKKIMDWNSRTGFVDGRVFRSSFYRGFTSAVGEKACEARQEALRAHDAQRDHVVGTSSVEGQEAVTTFGAEIVIRNKEVEVADFKKSVSRARGAYKGSNAGYNSGAASRGRSAGQRANLGTNKALSYSKAVAR